MAHHHHSHHGHDHAGGHGHNHGHAHGSGSHNVAFAVGVSLNLAFVIVEIIAGLSANSLALLSDAGHNLSDVIGLALAWGASHLTQRAPTQRHTYGLRRSSILTALLNATLLLIAIGGIVWEAIQRFGNPEAVGTSTVMWIAAAGVFVNGISALFFVAGSKGDLNIRGAFLHLATDAVVSAGVVLTGLVIGITGWLWLDPLVSIVISIVIAVGTWHLLSESLNLAMDAVPSHIDPQAVNDFLRSQAGVLEVHDLHIWGMSTTETALTVHLVTEGSSHDNAFLHTLNEELKTRFRIEHSTIQLERPDPEKPCPLAPSHVV